MSTHSRRADPKTEVKDLECFCESDDKRFLPPIFKKITKSFAEHRLKVKVGRALYTQERNRIAGGKLKRTQAGNKSYTMKFKDQTGIKSASNG